MVDEDDEAKRDRLARRALRGAKLSVEEEFLETIRLNRADDMTRLVYADWLEERGDKRADYIRAFCAWCSATDESDAAALASREQALRVGLPPDWLARIRGIYPLRTRSRR